VILSTGRLVLRRLDHGDAPFILRLVNEPAWLRHIGDKKVRDLADARRYLEQGPLASYRRNGFGLWLVSLSADGAEQAGTPVGLCGFLQREELPDPDIGFALLSEHWRQGFAFEAAAAALDFGWSELGFLRVAAVTALENEASGQLLAKLGFSRRGTIRLGEPAEELNAYGIERP